MNKIVRRILVFALLVTTVAYMNPAKVSAGDEKPTTTWNLSKKGTYYGYGKANSIHLFSNYLFTGASKLKVAVDNKGTEKLTVEIYRSDSAICYYRYVVPAGEGHIFSMSSNSSKKYYFKFKKPSNFEWWVKAG